MEKTSFCPEWGQGKKKRGDEPHLSSSPFLHIRLVLDIRVRTKQRGLPLLRSPNFYYQGVLTSRAAAKPSLPFWCTTTIGVERSRVLGHTEHDSAMGNSWLWGEVASTDWPWGPFNGQPFPWRIIRRPNAVLPSWGRAVFCALSLFSLVYFEHSVFDFL